MTSKTDFKGRGRLLSIGCMCVVLLAAGCAKLPAPAGAPAPPAPTAMPDACMTILNPDLQVLARRNPPPVENFYWMFSMSFQGKRPMGCLRVWGRTKVNGQVSYIDISHGGIVIPNCAKGGKGIVTITKRLSKRWSRTLAVAQFGANSYIECDINLMNEILKTDQFEDSNTGQPTSATLAPETIYTNTFALGAAGSVAQGAAATADNTALIYEPDQQTCRSQVKDPATCKPLAQQLLRQGSDIFMRSYFNNDVGGGQGSNTGHAFLNTLTPSNPSQCSFAPATNPLDETQQQVWWASIGYDVDAKAQGFFHTVYDIGNLTKSLGCDRPDPVTPTQANVWTGDAKIYIGGSPYSNSWEGELFELTIDPLSGGAGSDS